MSHEAGINDAYQQLNMRAQMLYEFVILYHNYIYNNHSYGTEESLNMMEIHTLTYIEDNPGVTVTELAKMWRKTKSAVSQAVKKLIANGYVEKRYKENNEKSFHLYATSQGRQLSYVHKAYDVADITQTTNYLVNQCGKDDVAAFYRVLEKYTLLLKED